MHVIDADGGTLDACDPTPVRDLLSHALVISMPQLFWVHAEQTKQCSWLANGCDRLSFRHIFAEHQKLAVAVQSSTLLLTSHEQHAET